MSPEQWTEVVILFRRVTFADGTKATGPLMRRRRDDGSWEYRRMTQAEEAEYTSTEAW